MKKGVLLNPNCSTIVCALPTYGSIETSKEVLEEVKKSNLEKSTKSKLQEILYEWSYDERYECCTESYPDGTLECFIERAEGLYEEIKDIKNFPEPRYVDNLGGGGHWGVVEVAWNLAKLVAFKKISAEEAHRLDKKMGEQVKMVLKCKNCLEKEPNTECEDYVKRIVGECEGKFEKTLKEYTEELMEEVAAECSTQIAAK